jgi:mannan endo-1,4-beta-mannosidase
MFDRLVKHHRIKNLIWISSVDRPEGSLLKFEECWPGSEYVDMLSPDRYREFKQSYYNDLLRLANGKSIGLAEVGAPLLPGVLEAQPERAWWMTRVGLGARGDAAKRIAGLVQEPNSRSLSDREYRKALAPIRLASGLDSELPAAPAP